MSVESRLKELIAAHFRISVESVRETTDFYTDLEADVLDLPELAMEAAVKGMLPKNSLGAKAFTRLKVYAGETHVHEAQKPVAVEF